MYLSKTFISQVTNDAERVQVHACTLWSVEYRSFLQSLTHATLLGIRDYNKFFHRSCPSSTLPSPSMHLRALTHGSIFFCSSTICVLIGLFSPGFRQGFMDSPLLVIFPKHIKECHCIMNQCLSLWRCSPLMAQLKNLSLSLLCNLPPAPQRFRNLVVSLGNP